MTFVLHDVHSQRVYLQEERLTAFSVCYRTVSMAAVYQLKIKYDQHDWFKTNWRHQKRSSEDGTVSLHIRLEYE